jgi:hypothetical protein
MVWFLSSNPTGNVLFCRYRLDLQVMYFDYVPGVLVLITIFLSLYYLVLLCCYILILLLDCVSQLCYLCKLAELIAGCWRPYCFLIFKALKYISIKNVSQNAVA